MKYPLLLALLLVSIATWVRPHYFETSVADSTCTCQFNWGISALALAVTSGCWLPAHQWWSNNIFVLYAVSYTSLNLTFDNNSKVENETIDMQWINIVELWKRPIKTIYDRFLTVKQNFQLYYPFILSNISTKSDLQAKKLCHWKSKTPKAGVYSC